MKMHNSSTQIHNYISNSNKVFIRNIKMGKVTDHFLLNFKVNTSSELQAINILIANLLSNSATES